MKMSIDFIKFSNDFKKTYGNKLSLISTSEDYLNLNSEVTAKCDNPSHEPTTKKARLFRRGFGCKNCAESKGERLTRLALEELGIKFEQEKRFASCRDKKELPFDFFLNDHVCLIEFQGRQHFEGKESWGGIQAQQELSKRDSIKKEWAKNNSIPLLELKTYKDFKKQILEFLNKNSKKNVKEILAKLYKSEKEWTKKKWDYYHEKLSKKHPSYDFSNSNWQWGQKHIDYYCAFPEHGLRNGNLQALLKGHGCSRCSGQDINIKDIIERSQKKFGKKFNFSKAKFIGMEVEIEIICDIHGSILLTPEEHFRLSNGCKKCSPKAKPKDDEKFLERTKKFNGRFEYFYDEFTTQEKILILCKKHNHEFKILQGDHTRHITGGCKYCVEESRSSNKGTSIVVGGKEYPSITKAAEAYNLKSSTVRKRLRNGKTIEEAFQLKSS